MKKLLVIMLAVATRLSSPATAANVCVKNSLEPYGCTSYASSNGGAGGSAVQVWAAVSTEARCNVSGISICVSSGTSPAAGFGSHCWCRMTSPRAGNWVYYANHGSGDHCLKDCSWRCGECVSAGENNNCTRAEILDYVQ